MRQMQNKDIGKHKKKKTLPRETPLVVEEESRRKTTQNPYTPFSREERPISLSIKHYLSDQAKFILEVLEDGIQLIKNTYLDKIDETEANMKRIPAGMYRDQKLQVFSQWKLPCCDAMSGIWEQWNQIEYETLSGIISHSQPPRPIVHTDKPIDKIAILWETTSAGVGLEAVLNVKERFRSILENIEKCKARIHHITALVYPLLKPPPNLFTINIL